MLIINEDSSHSVVREIHIYNIIGHKQEQYEDRWGIVIWDTNKSHAIRLETNKPFMYIDIDGDPYIYKKFNEMLECYIKFYKGAVYRYASSTIIRYNERCILELAKTKVINDINNQ